MFRAEITPKIIRKMVFSVYTEWYLASNLGRRFTWVGERRQQMTWQNFWSVAGCNLGFFIGPRYYSFFFCSFRLVKCLSVILSLVLHEKWKFWWFVSIPCRHQPLSFISHYIREQCRVHKMSLSTRCDEMRPNFRPSPGILIHIKLRTFPFDNVAA